MNRPQLGPRASLLTSVFLCLSIAASAWDETPAISEAVVSELNEKLKSSDSISSTARKKLALKRVVRECESLISRHSEARGRFPVLDVLYRSQQKLVSLDNSAINRRAFLKTCELLAAAPDEYAAIRIDADLLLSQTRIARAGQDLKARADALRVLLKRYRDTDVEKKAVRVTMLMALEFGDAALIGDVRKVIAERFAGDQELINFQRDKLAGQVFGAPFIGRFERTDGKLMCFPMDSLGITTACYFWSKESGGLEDLTELAAAWNAVKSEDARRMRFVSFNLDDLPDAGESILRELKLDWPALKLPGGRNNPTYKTYVRSDPKVLTVSPTGYAALTISGGRRTRGYERNLQSMLARTWTHQEYNRQLQSVLAGEFLVMDPLSEFNSQEPPEWQAVHAVTGDIKPLTPASNNVPQEKLQKIQACFVPTPQCYSLTHEELIANYSKAEQLCQQVMAQHSSAENLWLVRNRRIVSLMALWKVQGRQGHFESAFKESQAAIEAGYPPGMDIVAQFCLARAALRDGSDQHANVIRGFAESQSATAVTGNAVAALLALEAGDRQIHEKHRGLSLNSDVASLWRANAFLLDRYQRYWLYHPPFVAGWTYGRRQGHFMSVGTPEETKRNLNLTLHTPEGEQVNLPKDSDGKWTVLYLFAKAKDIPWVRRRIGYLDLRPVDDIRVYAGVYDETPDAVRAVLAEAQKPDRFDSLLVPEGPKNPLLTRLGIVPKEGHPNLLILRPDGTVALALSGLSMSAQKEDVVRNVMEWHDELAVDRAISSGSINEAERLALTFAPLADPDTDPRKLPKISVPHRRSRAKVLMAQKRWQAAYDDADQVYLDVNSKAGWLSLRTDELTRTEALKAKIREALELESGTQ